MPLIFISYDVCKTVRLNCRGVKSTLCSNNANRIIGLQTDGWLFGYYIHTAGESGPNPIFIPNLMFILGSPHILSLNQQPSSMNLTLEITKPPGTNSYVLWFCFSYRISRYIKYITIYTYVCLSSFIHYMDKCGQMFMDTPSNACVSLSLFKGDILCKTPLGSLLLL